MKKKKRTSPTQLSLKLMRRLGYMCGIVEKWNMHAKVRQDLFGCIDIVAVGGGVTVGIQACIGDDLTTRLKKIHGLEYEDVPVERRLHDASWQLVIHGWRKLGSRWVCRIYNVHTGEEHDLTAPRPPSKKTSEQGSQPCLNL